MAFNFDSLLSAFRSPNTMGGNKPYIDESGAFGRKRFTSGTTPSWEEQYKPHQAQAGPNPWERKEEDTRDEGLKYYDELEKIRTNRGPALSAYQKALGEQPTYEQHKPSVGRRIAAALGGAAGGLSGDLRAGLAIGESIRDSPYNIARSEYEERMKGLGASAKLEQDEMEAKLKSLQAARALGLDYSEYELKKLESQRDYEIAQGNLDVNRFTAETGRESQKQTGRHYENQDVTGAVDSRTRQLTQQQQGRNIESQISDRAERQDIAREAIEASIRRAEIAAGRKTPSSPDAQQDAIDGALREMLADPVFRNYIETDANGIPNVKEDDGTENYKRFRNQLIQRTHRRLTTGMPFGEPEDESDIEILPNLREAP